ncbi:430_t:CDS:2, partial [Cetraspora pellucida]
MTITQAPTLDELKEFKLIRVLNEDPRTKSITFLGTICTSLTDESHQAILIFEKFHFENSEHEILTSQRIDQLVALDKNDIYH